MRPTQTCRADEFFYDPLRPAAAVKIRSGLDASGKIVMWDYGIYGMAGAAPSCSTMCRIIALPSIRDIIF